jgi:hypothetical protein
MARPAFKITGYRDVMRALKTADKDSKTAVRTALRESGESVKREAAGTMASVDARTAAGYKVGVTQRGVRVYQSVRKVTGLHPEYGVYQMRHALIPALNDNQANVEQGLEHALDVVAQEFNRGGASGLDRG